MVSSIEAGGGRIDGIYFCPHAPGDNCSCRKPEIGMGLRAMAERGIDPARSYMIGDKEKDIEFGRRLGCRGTVMVGAGKTFSQAVDEILKDCRSQSDGHFQRVCHGVVVPDVRGLLFHCESEGFVQSDGRDIEGIDGEPRGSASFLAAVIKNIGDGPSAVPPAAVLRIDVELTQFQGAVLRPRREEAHALTVIDDVRVEMPPPHMLHDGIRADPFVVDVLHPLPAAGDDGSIRIDPHVVGIRREGLGILRAEEEQFHGCTWRYGRKYLSLCRSDPKESYL